MADVKISALPAASTPLTGAEVLPIVQSSVTTKVAVSNLTAGLAGTASININGTVGATTPTTGAFTSGTFSTTLGVTGTLTVSGTGSNAIGGSTNANRQLAITGAFTPGAGGEAANLWIDSSVSPQANANAGIVRISGTIVEASAGTHGLFYGTALVAPTITVGAAAVTTAATLYVDGPPAASGATNYSLYVASGAAQFGGTLGVTGAVTISASGAGLSVGPGGTSGNGIIYVTGGSDTNRGAAIDFMRAGVLKGEIGTNSLVINGTDSDLAYWANTGLGHRWYTNGSLTAGMTLSSAGIVTMAAYGAGAATFSAAGVISSVSDETWKTKDGIPTDPDAMLNKLEPGYWYYNDEKKETFGKDRQLGFYAQNVNAAIGPEAAPVPETVTTKNEDGTETTTTKPWGYYDRSVLAVTVMSLQKALATIESLTARITALEAK